MTQQLNVLAMSGSLRSTSFNTAALRAAQELAPQNLSIEMADLSAIPNYDQDLRDEAVPASVLTLTMQLRAADALLIATPEYNYSIPGVLKNAIDWLSRETPNPLTAKPAAILSASAGGMGGVRAQYDLRKILIFSDVHVLNKPEVMIGSAASRFDGAGRLTDESSRDHIAALLVSLHNWTLQLQEQGETKPA